MNINQETSEEQSPEDEIKFVVIQEEGQHPIHQMQGFLVPSKRERDQNLESVVIVQGVESDQPFPENFIGISSRRSSDKIQNLRGNFLREDSYHMVELGVRLGEPHLSCIRPEGLELHQNYYYSIHFILRLSISYIHTQGADCPLLRNTC